MVLRTSVLEEAKYFGLLHEMAPPVFAVCEVPKMMCVATGVRN
jgi:hypothetical protein